MYGVKKADFWSNLEEQGMSTRNTSDKGSVPSYGKNGTI
jgi:hypothetical protein